MNAWKLQYFSFTPLLRMYLAISHIGLPPSSVFLQPSLDNMYLSARSGLLNYFYCAYLENL